MRREAFCRRRTDAFHSREPVDGAERAERIAVGDDAASEHGTHPWKTGEVGVRCEVDVERRGGGGTVVGRRSSRRRIPRRAPGFPASGLPAVHPGRGVDGRELSGERAPGFSGCRGLAGERAKTADAGSGGRDEGEEEQRPALRGGRHDDTLRARPRHAACSGRRERRSSVGPTARGTVLLRSESDEGSVVPARKPVTEHAHWILRYAQDDKERKLRMTARRFTPPSAVLTDSPAPSRRRQPPAASAPRPCRRCPAAYGARDSRCRRRRSPASPWRATGGDHR